MRTRMKGKTVLITGASSGVGSGGSRGDGMGADAAQ